MAKLLTGCHNEDARLSHEKNQSAVAKIKGMLGLLLAGAGAPSEVFGKPLRGKQRKRLFQAERDTARAACQKRPSFSYTCILELAKISSSSYFIKE